MNIATAVETTPSCTVCGTSTQPVYRELYDDRYGYPDAFTLYACGKCGHMHIPTYFTPEDLGQLYTKYYPRGNFDLDNFRPEEEQRGFMSWLKGEGAAEILEGLREGERVVPATVEHLRDGQSVRMRADA